MILKCNHSILTKLIKSNPTNTLGFRCYKRSLILINAYKK
ncbi:hypothetical protein HPHPA11_0043 [Helicobacter pylori Hp A-11]|uniref:Uncharacterized protein n=1 Tax=Helicobacter pylori Hp A-11 TaxID=992035 RepID=N4TI35_HELPX|nr:hypothetical protein HPHPA11_0043 [Helicobacter pylori Hp A-11]